MSYKPVKLRIPEKQDEFEIINARTLEQRNGVKTTVAEALKNEGFFKKKITIFANGKRNDDLGDILVPGASVKLAGKYSQHNVFVALSALNA